MKSYFLMLVFLCVTSVSNAMDDGVFVDPIQQVVRLPSAAGLKMRLNLLGLSHFCKKTSMHTELAHKWMEPIGLYIKIGEFVYNYSMNCLKSRKDRRKMVLIKDDIVKACLERYPSTITRLINNGYFLER